ncbi:MAG: cation transporter [Ruminococcaceae bacterium]|nr:cation transporter [Oscillospiraceae bacterium]
MKTEKNIFIAFILNLTFSVIEYFGGIFTGSVAIMSDALHDLGDAAGIGVSWFLEKKSKKKPDDVYTYGYTRYSIIGSVITTSILLFGSLAVIYNAICKIINPISINYSGMIIFAIVGLCVNFAAVFFTREGHSLNQKAVNLHMLEDVLGWAVVLMGAIVMKFTDFALIDPVMSVGVALFILVNAVRNLKASVDLFLEKVPQGISIAELKEHIMKIDGVQDVHHIHVWSMDTHNNFATMHIVTNSDPHEIKHKIREELSEHGIFHATLELEAQGEHCHSKHCVIETENTAWHQHHHHHH